MTTSSDHVAARLLLMAITDRRQCEGRLLPVVTELIDGGVTAIMLREKDLSPKALLAMASPLRRLCGERDVLFLINGSVEVALACDADGVHLGWEALPVAVVRRLLPPGRLVGVSAHGRENLVQAASAGADYATLSPVFEPNAKTVKNPPLGIASLQACAGLLPLVALGGLTPARAPACLRAGAIGVAAIGSLIGARHPGAAATAFRRRLAGV